MIITVSTSDLLVLLLQTTIHCSGCCVFTLCHHTQRPCYSGRLTSHQPVPVPHQCCHRWSVYWRRNLGSLLSWTAVSVSSHPARSIWLALKPTPLQLDTTWWSCVSQPGTFISMSWNNYDHEVTSSLSCWPSLRVILCWGSSTKTLITVLM